MRLWRLQPPGKQSERTANDLRAASLPHTELAADSSGGHPSSGNARHDGQDLARVAVSVMRIRSKGCLRRKKEKKRGTGRQAGRYLCSEVAPPSGGQNNARP